jgi:hypothetical protein
VAAVDVVSPFMPPPSPHLNPPDEVSTRQPVVDASDPGLPLPASPPANPAERYVVPVEDITPDSTSAYNVQLEEKLFGTEFSVALRDPLSQVVGFDRAPSGMSSLRTPSLSGFLSNRASPLPPPRLTVDDLVTAALRPGPFSVEDTAENLSRHYSAPTIVNTMEFMLTLARATRAAVAREYATTVARAFLSGGSDTDVLARVRAYIDALTCDH